jgi:broad specificity phosphatase PhoE
MMNVKLKLILLCHQECSVPKLFTVPLTEEGEHLALSDTMSSLHNLPIDEVYSSPYLYVLQTIEPYIRNHNKAVRVEYALREYVSNVGFNLRNRKRIMSDEWVQHFNIDMSYNSQYDNLLENEVSVRNRIKEFIEKLYDNTSAVSINEKVVLLATVS